MSERFFNDPILNSPYDRPTRHWELDPQGIPTQAIIETRRESRLISPIPKPRSRGGKAEQRALAFEAQGLSDENQQYELTQQTNSIRSLVEEWRQEPESKWRVAPKLGKRGKDILDKLDSANGDANPDLLRIALNLATGAGQTTVMAMLIAWLTINAACHSGSSRFTTGFLVVAPGLTIKDRLRVLQPNDTESSFRRMELVPLDLVPELGKARIVICNYHAFRRRELLDLAKGTRQLMEGWRQEKITTTETQGEMLQWVMSELMGEKQVLVNNDTVRASSCDRPTSSARTTLIRASRPRSRLRSTQKPGNL